MTIKLKPVASNNVGTVSDIVEAEEANNVEVSRIGGALWYRVAKDVCMIQFKQNFNTLSTLSLAVSLMATWETVCSTIGSGLVSGGPVSLIYGFLRMNTTLCSARTKTERKDSQYPSSATCALLCRWVSWHPCN